VILIVNYIGSARNNHAYDSEGVFKMSFEGTTCPCGGKKQPNTMLCNGCETTFADHPSMKSFKSEKDAELRRHAALTLLSLARGRNNYPRRKA
jgi:hypothetical protein